tara:strand:+ start:1910 stop:3061 length:1152 start_codon:yes stop_codon:yes gene_type:complete
MILTIAEDLTSLVSLDTQLTAIPNSGMYLNSGVHPSITVNNLLSFLPNLDITFTAYDAGVTYGKYEDSRKVGDIVLYNSVVYQSISTTNTGNTPDSSATQWLPTNIESLRIKTFAYSSEDNALKRLRLTRRLIDNQYLYNVAEPTENPISQLLPNDYAAWVFEPKGSDYVKIRLNQGALQATTATPQSLYVINQGQLVTTLTLNPNVDGRLEFEDLGYTFYGKGKWIFAIDSQVVLRNGSTIDPLKYTGFVAYTATGSGASPQAADYSFSNNGNGLSFNVSAFLDADIYKTNNLLDFGNYIQVAWELDVLNMYLHNSNNRSNLTERTQLDKQMLIAETKELEAESVLKRYKSEKKEAFKMIERTFDNFLMDDDEDFEIQISSY